MKHNLLSGVALVAVMASFPQAFVNTNAKSSFWISNTEENEELTMSEYELLTWIEVGKTGNHGETGNNTNILVYDTWSDSVSDKAKGMTNAGDPTVEVARVATDPGQILMRDAAAVGNNNKYAFKIIRNDAPIGGTPTIVYNRGIVTGPTTPNGRNEDFDLEVYTLGLVQEQMTDPATV